MPPPLRFPFLCIGAQRVVVCPKCVSLGYRCDACLTMLNDWCAHLGSKGKRDHVYTLAYDKLSCILMTLVNELNC